MHQWLRKRVGPSYPLLLPHFTQSQTAPARANGAAHEFVGTCPYLATSKSQQRR